MPSDRPATEAPPAPCPADPPVLTERHFWEDPYARQLDARIAAVAGDEIELDRTIFYAFSGGQESDAGTIGGLPVLEARLEGRRLCYRVPDGHGLQVGQPVTIEIDWARRYALMRLHFAAELVLETICRRFSGIERLGAHIAADKARIDFAWASNIGPHLDSIAADAQSIIDDDRPIVSAFSDREGLRRYWEVEGVARVPCGGTHLRRTGEVGRLSLKRRNVGSGKERVEIRVAD